MWPSSCYCHHRTRFEFHEFPPRGENRMAHCDQCQRLISYCQDISSWTVDVCRPAIISRWDKGLLTGPSFLARSFSKLAPPPQFQWVLYILNTITAWLPIFTLISHSPSHLSSSVKLLASWSLGLLPRWVIFLNQCHYHDFNQFYIPFYLLNTLAVLVQLPFFALFSSSSSHSIILPSSSMKFSSSSDVLLLWRPYCGSSTPFSLTHSDIYSLILLVHSFLLLYDIFPPTSQSRKSSPFSKLVSRETLHSSLGTSSIWIGLNRLSFMELCTVEKDSVWGREVKETCVREVDMHTLLLHTQQAPYAAAWRKMYPCTHATCACSHSSEWQRTG